MSDDRKLEVIDPNGWRKEYPLEKTVIFIGSDPASDIPLRVDPGAGIAARHLQLIAVPDVGYRLVNLGESGVLVGPAGDREITPRASAELTEGEQIKIGEFILIVRGEVWSSGGAAGPTSRSKNIGLSLTLPKSELAPHETLEGIVTVFNLGDFSGAQFDLDLAGFDSDCFELEPGPLLSSGADKEVLFRLYHLGHKPLAGDVNLTGRAMAPKAYPAEQVSVSRLVRVLPYYSYQLALITPGAAKPAAPPAKQPAPAIPVRPPAKPAPARPSQPAPAPSAETADWWSAELPVKTTPPPQAEAESSGPPAAVPPAPAPEPDEQVAIAAASRAEVQPLPPVEQAEARPPEQGRSKIFRLLSFFRRQPTAAPAGSLATAPVELPPQIQPEVEAEPLPPRPVEPPGEQPHLVAAESIEAKPVEVEPVEIEPVEAEPVEAEPVETEPASLPTELESPAPAAAESSPQPEPEPLPPEAETPPPPSPRELAMAATPASVEGDDWWSPPTQPEPTPADETWWSAAAAAKAAANEVEPESTPPLGEDNLPPSLQGKKVLKITASQPPPVESKMPAAAGAETADWWSASEVEPVDESTQKAETDSQE